MELNSHVQYILKNSKKDTEWKKEAEERKSVRQESEKAGKIATQLAFYMKSEGIPYRPGKLYRTKSPTDR